MLWSFNCEFQIAFKELQYLSISRMASNRSSNVVDGLGEITSFTLGETGISIHSPGVEDGKWRQEYLVRSLLKHLPSFTGVQTEPQVVSPDEVDEIIEKSARLVYSSSKYRNRGEFGELILHVLLEKMLGLELVISKIIHKTSLNDTVKGFDTVFIETGSTDPMLWLGESKLYTDFQRAHTDVRTELKDHLGTNYLRDEFMLIAPKIPDNHPSRKKILEIIESTQSMDDLRERLKVPVLLGYEEASLAASNLNSSFLAAHAKDQRGKYESIWQSKPIDFYNAGSKIFLLPYPNKESFVAEFDRRLKMKAGLY